MIEAKVNEIYAKHLWQYHSYPNKNGYRRITRLAYMTIWAITELNHHVWLKTKNKLDTKRIEIKIKEAEKEFGFLIGKSIAYSLSYKEKWYDSKIVRMGFIRRIK